MVTMSESTEAHSFAPYQETERWFASFREVTKVAQNHKASASSCERSCADDLISLESSTQRNTVESCTETDQLFSCSTIKSTVAAIDEIMRMTRDVKRRAKLMSEGA